MNLTRFLLASAVFTQLLMACGPGEQTTTPKEQIVAPAAETPALPASETDPASGLIIDEHWEMVRANCSACHSAQLVTQNRGTRQNWLDMIRWMQESQGLWPFDPATETAILDYLEKNYAPTAIHRRAPISEALMPENPYVEK